MWRKNEGTQAGYNAWRANFGRTVGSGSSIRHATGVPEPATGVLAVLSLCGLALRRWQSG